MDGKVLYTKVVCSATRMRTARHSKFTLNFGEYIIPNVSPPFSLRPHSFHVKGDSIS